MEGSLQDTLSAAQEAERQKQMLMDRLKEMQGQVCTDDLFCWLPFNSKLARWDKRYTRLLVAFRISFVRRPILVCTAVVQKMADDCGSAAASEGGKAGSGVTPRTNRQGMHVNAQCMYEVAVLVSIFHARPHAITYCVVLPVRDLANR